MSGKEFFVDRYKQLGWDFKEDVQPRQAIRINVTNTKGKNIEERLQNNGVQLEKVPFLKTLASSDASNHITVPGWAATWVSRLSRW